jgi:hypothetical protein
LIIDRSKSWAEFLLHGGKDNFAPCFLDVGHLRRGRRGRSGAVGPCASVLPDVLLVISTRLFDATNRTTFKPSRRSSVEKKFGNVE